MGCFRIGYQHLVRFGLGRGSWPIRIGCLNPKSQLPRLLMMTMQSLNNEDFYFICLEILCSGMAKTWQQGILHCVREGAGTADIIMGLLQACHIRKAILSSVCKWESILEAPDNSDSVSRHWFQLIEDSKRIAQRDFNLLNEQMLGLSWACKNILLSTQEQARYSFVDDRNFKHTGGNLIQLLLEFCWPCICTITKYRDISLHSTILHKKSKYRKN